MKLQLKFLIGLGVIAIASSCIALKAQTNLPAIPNFFNQAANWGTSFNTNDDHNWSASTISWDTGIATVTGVGISDRMNVFYYKGSFSFGGTVEFQGVGSAFSEAEATLQYSLIQKYDFKFGITLGAGYDFNNIGSVGHRNGSVVIEPGLFTSKIMTANTYATMSLTMPIETHGKFGNVPTLYVGVGTRF